MNMASGTKSLVGSGCELKNGHSGGDETPGLFISDTTPTMLIIGTPFFICILPNQGEAEYKIILKFYASGPTHRNVFAYLSPNAWDGRRQM